MRRWHTQSAEETVAVGGEIARLLPIPSVVLLEGELGAGKTTMMQGVAEALSAGDVSSPTFALVHELAGERDGEPVSIRHLDLYRLASELDLLTLGLEEMFEHDIVFIEWGSKFPSLVERADAIIHLVANGEARIISMSEPRRELKSP